MTTRKSVKTATSNDINSAVEKVQESKTTNKADAAESNKKLEVTNDGIVDNNQVDVAVNDNLEKNAIHGNAEETMNALADVNDKDNTKKGQADIVNTKIVENNTENATAKEMTNDNAKADTTNISKESNNYK